MESYILLETVFHSVSFGLYFIKIHPEISEILQFNLQRQFKLNFTKLNFDFLLIILKTIRDTYRKLHISEKSIL